MADTRPQHAAETWVVGQFLSRKFGGQTFKGQRMGLVWGGEFAFDAVSADKSIVACISTSAVRTATNRFATAKVLKLKCDCLYLLHVSGDKHLVMVFTEASMHEHLRNEQRKGRFPPNVELLHAPLPAGLQQRVAEARQVASMEVSPNAQRGRQG